MRDLRLLATVILGLSLAVAQPAGAEILPSADVAVSLSENRSPEPAVAGYVFGLRLTYTITVRNNGTASAQAVTVADTLPPHTTFMSFGQTGGPPFTLAAPASGGAGTATATTATFDPGASASFELTVGVNPDTAEGTMLVNTARVNSQSFDPAPANDTATTTTRVTTYAGFYVDVSDSAGLSDRILRGRDLSYVLMVENNGPSDAQEIVLTDPIPSNTSFVSFTQTSGPAFVLAAPPVGSTAPAAVTATVATLAFHAIATFTLVVKVDPAAADGAWITNTVRVNSPTRCAYDPTVTCGSLSRGYPPNHRSDTELTRVAAFEADLAVSVSDSPDPVEAGGELSYVCTVVNNGPDDAADVHVNTLDPWLWYIVSFVQNSGPPFYLHDPFATGALAVGEAATFTLVIKIESTTAPGTVITNTPWVYSNAYDPVQSNDRATTQTEVAAAPE